MQAALWNDKLNPEISSWKKVVAAAEIIEIAENVNGTSKEEAPRGDANNHASGSHSNARSHHGDSNRRFSSRDNHSQSSRGRGRGGHSRFGSTPRREFIKREPVDYGLSDKEKAARLADGRCFRCNKPGHTGRNCPDGHSVKHTGNKPPGVANFNMEFMGEHSSSDSNSAEVLDSLPLGHVTYENFEDSDLSDSPDICQRSRPAWMISSDSKPRRHIGDARAMVAEYILNEVQPFPGDDRFPQPHFENEFPDDDMYTVNDYSRGITASIHIARLRHDTFSIGKWYAEICAKHTD
ncbi:hypothetical protein M413DRAFT_67819, partial [Hebeloma cylindrosporum]